MLFVFFTRRTRQLRDAHQRVIGTSWRSRCSTAIGGLLNLSNYSSSMSCNGRHFIERLLEIPCVTSTTALLPCPISCVLSHIHIYLSSVSILNYAFLFIDCLLRCDFAYAILYCCGTFYCVSSYLTVFYFLVSPIHLFTGGFLVEV